MICLLSGYFPKRNAQGRELIPATQSYRKIANKFSGCECAKNEPGQGRLLQLKSVIQLLIFLTSPRFKRDRRSSRLHCNPVLFTKTPVTRTIPCDYLEPADDGIRINFIGNGDLLLRAFNRLSDISQRLFLL